jgi:UDP-glucose 4-epimerase
MACGKDCCVIAPIADSGLDSQYRDRAVLVTGGLGFLGTNLALKLVSLGARVAVIDSLVPEGGGNQLHQHQLAGLARIEVADLRDQVHLARLVADRQVVFHLAARTSHLDSMCFPFADLEANVAGTLGVLEACRHHAPDVRLVFTSTRQVYGPPREIPVDEAHPVAPVDVNAVHKLAAEQHLQLYERVYGLPVSILRLTNVVGPRMRIRDARQSFVGDWIRRLRQHEPIEVWGGAQQRDLLDVDDAVAALLLAGSHPAAVGEIFNVGHADPIRLDHLARQLIDRNGAGQWIVRAFQPERSCIDIGSFATDSTRLRERLGWLPQIRLEHTLDRTLVYYHQYGCHYV